MKLHTIALTILVIQFSYSCKKEYVKQAENTKSNPKKVRVANLDDQAVVHPVLATGILASKEEILLSFKTGGIVSKLNYQEGAAVNQGDKMASLDLSEINAQVESAKNGYQKAVRDYNRVANLYEDTVATLEQLQDAQTGRDIAKSNLDIAYFNQRYSVVRSPIKGTVLKRFVEEGQLVSPGQPVFLVGSSGTQDAQIIRVGLSDKDIVNVSLNDKALISFDAFPKTDYKGVLTEIAQAANERTGLYEIEITLLEYQPELKNGFIARLKIMPKVGKPVYKIPINALVEGVDKKATIFYTVNNDVASSLTVDIIGLYDEYFTISTSELPSNARIITEGAPFIRSNDSILVQP